MVSGHRLPQSGQRRRPVSEVKEASRWLVSIGSAQPVEAVVQTVNGATEFAAAEAVEHTAEVRLGQIGRVLEEVGGHGLPLAWRESLPLVQL